MVKIDREVLLYNDNNIELLKIKIKNCIMKKVPFKILCFDIDDTLNRSKKATEEQIEKINFKASEKYRNIYLQSHPFFGDQDNQEFKMKFFDLRNQILEDYGKYYGAMDYELIHTEERLYPTVKEGFRTIVSNRKDNTFVVLLSHYNPERESIIKIRNYYNYMTKNDGNLLDAIITLPVFMERYEPNGKKRDITSKALYLLHRLELPAKYIFNCYLIDDSSSVRRDFKEKGGIVIPAYLELGYIKELEDDPEDVNRVITDMNPKQFYHVLDTIEIELKTKEKTKNFTLKKGK